MSFFLIVLLAVIALQFTSGIAEFVATNKAATKTQEGLGWLASKIGLAPSIITTRVLIIAVFVAVYLLLPSWMILALVAGGVYYLWKTSKYLLIWKKLETVVASKVVSDVESAVEAKIDKAL